MYDIIGDVHGYSGLLKDLLVKMDYKKDGDFFYHPERKAVFVGDFINRGPDTLGTIKIIRTMVERGSAYAVLGNHEINALYYSLRDKKGHHLTKKWSRLHLDLNSVLSEFVNNPSIWENHIKWLRTLPLFLDLGPIRIVHACWKDENIRLLKKEIDGDKLKKSFLKKISKNNSQASSAFWETCKGVDFRLPKDILIYDKNGTPHRSFRSKWWTNPEGKTFRDLSFESRFKLPSYTIPKEVVSHCEPYAKDNPIVFFGHYCLKGSPNIISDNLCCLDSCVYRKGNLTAYRWSGEKKLKEKNLV